MRDSTLIVVIGKNSWRREVAKTTGNPNSEIECWNVRHSDLPIWIVEAFSDSLGRTLWVWVACSQTTVFNLVECLHCVEHFALVKDIEITSWKARAYGIFTRVGEVSEIERVSAANEWDFWYFTNECENPVQSAFHAVICLFYTYWDFFYLSSFNWFSKIITKLQY